MYFEDEYELNDYILDKKDKDSEENWKEYLREIGYYEQYGVDRYIREEIEKDYE